MSTDLDQINECLSVIGCEHPSERLSEIDKEILLKVGKMSICYSNMIDASLKLINQLENQDAMNDPEIIQSIALLRAALILEHRRKKPSVH